MQLPASTRVRGLLRCHKSWRFWKKHVHSGNWTCFSGYAEWEIWNGSSSCGCFQKRGTPKSSILIGFSICKPSILGGFTLIFGKHPCIYVYILHISDILWGILSEISTSDQLDLGAFGRACLVSNGFTVSRWCFVCFPPIHGMFLKGFCRKRLKQFFFAEVIQDQMFLPLLRTRW